MLLGYTANDGQAYSTPGFVFISYNSPANPPPTVALVSPAPYAVAAKSAATTLTATASDPQGVKKVEFYVGHKLVGTALAAPFTLTWSSAIAGRFQITAKAFDNLNAAAYSQPVIVTVQ